MLTEDEATAVLLGLVAASRLGLATAEPAIDGALAKILRVLPAPLRARLAALEETLGFTHPAPDAAPPRSETVLLLSQAASRRRRVRCTYTSWRGEQSERRNNPHG